MAKQDHVVVAVVVKPHGLRGELVLESYAESPELFGELPWVRLAPPQGRREKARRFEIETWRTHKGRVLVKFKGVEGRDQAETWREFLVTVSADLLPEPEDGTVYLHAILGCEVAAEDGSPLGVLDQFSEHGGQEVWSIATPDGREILLPARPEFVKDIDVAARRITVAPPPGLLDIYLAQDESS
ncbi:MAG: ribosome maturation factor RimM [Desulfovibrionaceae bacterium]